MAKTHLVTNNIWGESKTSSLLNSSIKRHYYKLHFLVALYVEE